MPVWHEATREAVKQGRLVVLGVTQEQHADRCRLFAQWKQLDWPILHDPINLLESSAVPIIVAIDEHGIVRSIRPRSESFRVDFLDKTFSDDASSDIRTASAPVDFALLRREAAARSSASAWRALGDALTVWQSSTNLDEAIESYARALRLDPTDRNSRFRMGVAHRMRYESSRRRAGDFQAAIDAWVGALALDPNQYIWRRRIEQYGPRLSKPYAFYDWVSEARSEIEHRGEVPLTLNVEPSGSEIASPRGDELPEPATPVEPDPRGQIQRDVQRLIDAEIAVVPSQAATGQALRVHLSFSPRVAGQAHWNNESTPLRVWIVGADGWKIEPQLLIAPQENQPISNEVRRLDCELRPPPAFNGQAQLSAYALYNACEEVDGRCYYLRQDLTIDLQVTR